MLLELHVRNFAIIRELTLSFAGGFSVFTGETGAGKSIIVDAVKLLLGDRTIPQMIRTGEEEAHIEGLFDITMKDAVRNALKEKGIDYEDTLLVRRIISKSERNRVYLNGQLSTISILNTICEGMIDIYGQHEHQSLLKPWKHIDLLDNYGGLRDLREKMRDIFKELSCLKKELGNLLLMEKERTGRKETLAYQLSEIERAGLRTGEDAALKKERERLRHGEALLRATRDGYERIYNSNNSIVEELGEVQKELEKASLFDEGLSKYIERLQEVIYELEDVSSQLRDYSNNMELNPCRLEEVENRLAAIGNIKRKYGETIEAIITYRDRIKEELRSMEEKKERIKEVEERVSTCEANALNIAEELSKKRRGVAKSLEREIIDELSILGMERILFNVSLSPCLLGEKGIDQVEFYLSPNKGESLMPLNKIASGGELSRIMLALKIVSKSGGVPTLIFDEVDTGIGGRIADRIGVRLKELSVTHQVFCITHLPQIASYADHHYLVSKAEDGGRTITVVKKLNEKERIEEISRMLGGTKVTEKTKEHAEEMLRGARL